MIKNIKKIILLPTICLIIYIFYVNDISFKCIFHEITGLYCPGCGITRMFIYIINLEIYKAFRSNILAFCLLPFMVIYYIYYVYITINNKKNIIINKIPSLMWNILLIITIVFGILRNISYFSFLAPIS